MGNLHSNQINNIDNNEKRKKIIMKHNYEMK